MSLKLNSSDSSVLTKCHRVLTSPTRSAITCLSWKSWISREARDPMLLANCANNTLCLYRLVKLNSIFELNSQYIMLLFDNSGFLKVMVVCYL